MPKTILTDTAIAKLAEAAGTGDAVEITHCALGDGLGAVYEPDHAQTALRRELARQPVSRRMLLGDNVWRATAEFDTSTPSFQVREIGFFDQDGDLIALWAGLDVIPRQTGVIEYLTEHLLDFSAVQSGLVTIVAPDDELSDWQIASLNLIGQLQLEQNRQRQLLATF